MTSTAMANEHRQICPAASPNQQQTLRLRAMIESWERDGLIRPDVAAQALAPEPGRTDAGAHSPARVRRLEVLGYLGAVPVAAAGLLLVQASAGLGSLLLIGLLIAVASPRTVRSAPIRAAGFRSRPPARHRALRPVTPAETEGQKAPELVLNGRFVPHGRAATLVSTGSR